VYRCIAERSPTFAAFAAKQPPADPITIAILKHMLPGKEYCILVVIHRVIGSFVIDFYKALKNKWLGYGTHSLYTNPDLAFQLNTNPEPISNPDKK
jgi:hypothetical protein